MNYWNLQKYLEITMAIQKPVEERIKNGKDVLFIDWQGTQALRELELNI